MKPAAVSVSIAIFNQQIFLDWELLRSEWVLGNEVRYNCSAAALTHISLHNVLGIELRTFQGIIYSSFISSLRPAPQTPSLSPNQHPPLPPPLDPITPFPFSISDQRLSARYRPIWRVRRRVSSVREVTESRWHVQVCTV